MKIHQGMGWGVPIVSYPLYRNNRSYVMDVMDRPKINKERTEDNLGVDGDTQNNRAEITIFELTN